jgi:hypothetical protein
VEKAEEARERRMIGSLLGGLFQLVAVDRVVAVSPDGVGDRRVDSLLGDQLLGQLDRADRLAEGSLVEGRAG